MKYFFLFIFILMYSFGHSSASKVNITEYNYVFSDTSILLKDSIKNSNSNNTKIIAVALALTLGPFGVHRLYLGTKPLVPIAYTLTLGGGFFILPLIDIVYILVAKDLKQIKNNNFVFIWNKNRILKKNL